MPPLGALDGANGEASLTKLGADLEAQRISRREFVRFAALVGMAAPAAYAMAGRITGEPFAPLALAEDLPKGGTWRIGSDLPHEVTAGPHGAEVLDVFAPRREDWESLERQAPRDPRWPAE